VSRSDELRAQVAELVESMVADMRAASEAKRDEMRATSEARIAVLRDAAARNVFTQIAEATIEAKQAEQAEAIEALEQSAMDAARSNLAGIRAQFFATLADIGVPIPEDETATDDTGEELAS
jgi:ethanolamine ammonia-lyase small subunit